MVQKQPAVAVVILNWNRKDILLECIQSVKDMEYSNTHIVVVDNNSSDGSVEAVKEHHDDVIIVENAENYGAPKGRNFGIERALQTDAEYIFSIDNDLVADKNLITAFLETFYSDSNIGCAGAKIYDYVERDLILSAGSKVDYTQNIVRQYGRGQKDRGQFNEVFDVDWVGTGAMMVRRDVYEKVGLFDPDYIGYGYEDADFGVRVTQGGYRCVFCPGAIVWHRPHSGVGTYTYNKKYLETRNAIYFMKKHARFHQWIKYLFIVILGMPYAFVREGLRGNLPGVLGKCRGLYDGLRGDDSRALAILENRPK